MTQSSKQQTLLQPSGGELFRMEKSVMTKDNFLDLSSVSGDTISEALLEYICYEHQYNIFGYGILDPIDFANKFRFSTKYLFGLHPSPYQKKIQENFFNNSSRGNLRQRIYSDVKSSELICGSRIENALYILANFPLHVTSTAVLEDQTLIRQYGSLRVLEQFAIIQDGKTGKITYAYKLDDKFRRNLTSMYLTTRLDSLAALRKTGLGILYVFLLKLRDALFSEGRTQTYVGNTPAFDYLCSLADIPEYDEAKYRKRDLNKAFKRISADTELQFSVNWEYGNGKERYTPVFIFQPAEGDIVGTGCQTYVKICRERERIDIAVHEFIHNLVEVCPFSGNRASAEAEDFFFGWIKSTDPQQELLIRYALEKTFVNIGCGIPRDIPDRIKLFRFYAERRPRNEFQSWIREIFIGSHGFSVPVFKCIDEKR